MNNKSVPFFISPGVGAHVGRDGPTHHQCQPGQATAQVCVARPQEPWLGSSGTLHYARPIQGNASQPRLSGKDRRYSLSFLPCSRQPRCAQGRAVACLSQSRAFTRRPAASTTLSQAWTSTPPYSTDRAPNEVANPVPIEWLLLRPYHAVMTQTNHRMQLFVQTGFGG